MSNHSELFILVLWYVILQLIYNTFIFSLLGKWGEITVFTFWFLKVLHLHVPNQKKHHCGSQRIRSVLLVGLYWPSSSCNIHKCNTWINPTYRRPCMHFYAYYIFLLNWDACLAVQDSHTDMNLAPRWYLASLIFFEKLDNWTSFSDGLHISFLTAYLLLYFLVCLICVSDIMLYSTSYLQWVGLYLIIWLEMK